MCNHGVLGSMLSAAGLKFLQLDYVQQSPQDVHKSHICLLPQLVLHACLKRLHYQAGAKAQASMYMSAILQAYCACSSKATGFPNASLPFCNYAW